jgi:hypothetical protein
MTDTVPIDAALLDENLLGAALGDPSTWRTWIAVLKAAYGRTLSAEETTAFDYVAGGRKPPARPVRELWSLCGRRSGKSRIAAAVSAYIATCLDHRGSLAPGETGMILCLAASRAQARLVHDYCKAFIELSPILRQRVEEITAEEIRLSGGVVIGVHSNSFRTVRGRSLLAAVLDETGYWRDETSAVPDVEVYRAILPALSTTRGLLVGISTPYRKTGLLYSKFRDHFGRDGDVLVIKAGSTVFNPTLDAALIEQACADDPASALSEWGAEFRVDLSSFLDDASIDAAIHHGRPMELPPRDKIVYHAFADMSGGRHDACCIGIVHREGERIIADVIRGRKGAPAAAAREFAALAREYGCQRITGDNYSAEWVAAAFRDAGCEYFRSPLTRSELYLDSLVHFTRGAVSIPNHPELIRELRLLERRTARSGKDTVDHGVGGSDDHANVLFGAMHLALKPALRLVAPIIVTSPMPGRIEYEDWLMQQAHAVGSGDRLYAPYVARYERGDF